MNKEEQIHDILLDCYDFNTGKLAIGKAERKLKAFSDRIEAEIRKQVAEEIIENLYDMFGYPATIDETTTPFVEGKIVVFRQVKDKLDELKAEYGIQETEGQNG